MKKMHNQKNASDFYGFFIDVRTKSIYIIKEDMYKATQVSRYV